MGGNSVTCAILQATARAVAKVTSSGLVSRVGKPKVETGNPPYPGTSWTVTNRARARTIVETVEVPSVWGPTSSEVASSDAKAAPPEAATPASTRATVRFVVRVEDVGTGRQWLVFPHYGDLSALRQELLVMWPPIADLPFPAKRSSASRAAAETAEAEETVVEERVVRLEAFLDGALALLGMYVSIDPR